MVVAAPTFEDVLIDSLLSQHGGRGRLRQLGDEDLHHARLAFARCEVLWEDALAEFGPERAITYLLAATRARTVVEEEESRRERARHRGVPRDAAAGWVPDEIVAEIKARTDLAALVQRWGLTDLRQLRAGKFVGRCPFHEDGTPSFYVFTEPPADQHFHCYGCGAHGDVFDLARRHGAWLSFREAVEGLASAAGVTWPPPEPCPPDQGRYLALARRASGHDA